jgi:membrane protease YdiL (CAAX protease family)
VTLIAEEPPEIVAESPPVQEFPWPGVGLFMLLATLGSALTLPYALEILDQLPARPGMQRPGSAALVFNVLFAGLLSLVPVAVGFRFGQPLGLACPPLRTRGEASRRFHGVGRALILSVALGIASALAAIGSSKMFTFPEGGTLKMPSWVAALLGSFGAGIREEIVFRFGLLTLVMWLLVSLSHDRASHRRAFWAANVLAALAFGAIHLPQAGMFGTVDAAVITWILIGNGVVGLACGWLYWREGIVAAMICHTSADILLKVILPLLSPGAA